MGDRPTDHADLQYNEHLEELIASEGEKALAYQWLHDRAEKLFSFWANAIALPVIILSMLSGTASIGQSTMFGDSPFSAIGIGLVSILVGVLNTISQHFALAKRAEGHRIASITYGKVYRTIAMELSLPRDQRLSADQFVKLVRDQADRLAETAPPIPTSIVTAFQRRFVPVPDGVSIPEICNGLHKIEVHPVRRLDEALVGLFRRSQVECLASVSQQQPQQVSLPMSGSTEGPRS